MAELTVSNLIKLVLGIFVFIAVVIGAYLIFKNNVSSFFEGIGGNSTKLLMRLI